jgi:hypothetical protein
MRIETQETKPRYGTVNFESRKHPRFNVDFPIEYDRIDSSVHPTGQALNISEEGLLIHFPEEMDVSQYIRLKLFLPSGSELNSIEMLAEVAWMDIHLDKDQGGGDYRCGVKFIDISKEDMTQLRKFLRSLSSP